MLQRLGASRGAHPLYVLASRHAQELERERGNSPTITATGLSLVRHPTLWRNEIKKGLPISWYERIKVNQMGHALRKTIGHRGNHHPPIAVSNQHHSSEVFVFQYGRDVLHVGLQVNRRREEVRPLAQTSEGRCEDLMMGRAEERRYFLPTPAPMKRPMHKGQMLPWDRLLGSTSNGASERRRASEGGTAGRSSGLFGSAIVERQGPDRYCQRA